MPRQGEAACLAPAKKSADGPGVGPPGVGVADGGGEEFDEASGGVVAGVGDDGRDDELAAGGQRCERSGPVGQDFAARSSIEAALSVSAGGGNEHFESRRLLNPPRLRSYIGPICFSALSSRRRAPPASMRVDIASLMRRDPCVPGGQGGYGTIRGLERSGHRGAGAQSRVARRRNSRRSRSPDSSASGWSG